MDLSFRFGKLYFLVMFAAILTGSALLAAGGIALLQYKGVDLVWISPQQINFLFNALSAVGALGAATFTIVPVIIAMFKLRKRRMYFTGRTREERVRRDLLNLVNSIWITGKLEHSLHRRLMIELDKEERLDVIDFPWGFVFESQERERKALPKNTNIINIFEGYGNNLLILGGPGSGKTTLLLALARDAIAHAKVDKTQPIPVILNLSSWSDGEDDIEGWLFDMLTSSLYKLEKLVAKALIHNNQLMLLLDGLDEVDASKRRACVEALNKFRQGRGLTPIAVCSRTSDYTSLTTRLQMQGAIVLQPLTSRQVQDYLAALGPHLEGLATAIKKNKMLSDLASSALMLNLMSLTYYGMSAASIHLKTSPKKKAKELIACYVERIFQRPRLKIQHKKEQTIQLLSWLAKNIPQRVFFVDQMQPPLLAGAINLYFNAIGILIILVSYFYFSMNLPLVGRMLGDRDISDLMIPVLYGIPPHIALACVREARKGLRLVETWKWSWTKARRSIRRGLLSLLLMVLLIWLSIEFRPIIQRVLVESLLFGSLGAALVLGYVWFNQRIGVGWPIFGFWGLLRLKRTMWVRTADIEKRKKVPFNVYVKRVFWRSLLFWGIVVGLLPLLVADVVRHPHPDVLFNFLKTAKISLVSALFFVPVVIFISGLSFFEAEEKVVPNQGIRISRQNAIRAFLLGIPIGLVVFFTIDRISTGGWSFAFSDDAFSNNPKQILTLTLSMAVLIGMVFGGFACLQHYVLRFFLILKGDICWRFEHS